MDRKQAEFERVHQRIQADIAAIEERERQSKLWKNKRWVKVTGGVLYALWGIFLVCLSVWLLFKGLGLLLSVLR